MASERLSGSSNRTHVLVAAASHIGFLLLCVSAVIFYEERLYGDSGAYMFDVINSRSFWVMNNRYILAVSQLFAVFAVWLHLPLKTVLIAYSLGHVLFFYTLFLIGHYGLKLKWSGPVFLVLQTLGVNFTYFAWPYGEIPYGIGIVMMMIMMIIALPRLNWLHLAAMSLLVFLAVTSHPFIIILTGLGLALLFVRPAYRKKALTVGGLLVAVFALKMLVIPSYDGDLVGQRMEEGITFGFNMNEVRGMIRIHAILFYSLVVLAIFQLVRKRWWWFAFTIPASFLILFVIKQYFPLDGATQQYYISFTGIFIITLMIDYFDREPLFGMEQVNSIALPAILIGLGVWSYFPILSISNEFSDRVDKLEMLIDQSRELDGERFIVNGYNYFKRDEDIWMESEIRIESVLLSCQEDCIVVSLYERAREQTEYITTGTSEFASPSTPGSKDKRYDIDEAAQQTLADRMVTYDFISNREYFPVPNDRPYFLNAYRSNSIEEIMEGLSVDIAAIFDRGYNNYSVDLTWKNKAGRPAYSGAQNNLLATVVLLDSIADFSTPLYTFPAVMDIDSPVKETVNLQNISQPFHPGDRFVIDISKDGINTYRSQEYIYPGG